MKRDLGKADEIFDVPAINFFTSGNDYFGSSGRKFRYRISHTDENIVGEVWHEDLCYERGFPVDAGRSYKLHKMASRKIRKHIRSLKSSKTEKAALGSRNRGWPFIYYYLLYIAVGNARAFYLTAKFHSTFSRVQASKVRPEQVGDICPLTLRSLYHTNP